MMSHPPFKQESSISTRFTPFLKSPPFLYYALDYNRFLNTN